MVRNYSQKKIQENIECEIMQVVLDEAKEGYVKEIVVELQNNTIEEMEQNIQRTQAWLSAWKPPRQ